MTKLNKKDLALGIFCILLAAFIACLCMGMGTTEYEGDPGPAVFPMIGSIIIALCGIALLVHPTKGTKIFLTRTQWKAAGSLFAVYVLLVLMFWLVGFVITVPVILFIMIMMLSSVSDKNSTLKKRIIKSLIFAIVAGAAIYLIYAVALDATLPKGIVWNLLK